MPQRRFVLPALLVALAAGSMPSAKADVVGPPDAAASAQAQTFAEMRNVGTALFLWLTDQASEDGASGDPKETPACVSTQKKKGGGCEAVEIDRLPVISHRELTRLLVPKYIAAIPEKDDWGNPYEFRLDRKHVLNKSVMAIRSAGADGVFSGDRYDGPGFQPAEANEDLVWIDGFFFRWPHRPYGDAR